MLEVLDDVQAGDWGSADDIDVENRWLFESELVAHQVFTASHNQKDVIGCCVRVASLESVEDILAGRALNEDHAVTDVGADVV